MMAKIYLRSCENGSHHVFKDDETGEIIVNTSEELRNDDLAKPKDKQDQDDKMNSIPSPLRSKIKNGRV